MPRKRGVALISAAARADSRGWEAPLHHTPSHRLESQLAHDPDMAELLELFINELPQRVESVTKAWESRELSTLKRLAHQLKGSCAGYGFPTIGHAAASVESDLAGDAPLERIAADVGELVALCRRAMSPNAGSPRA
jgi:HPt (histidine-containing phosphotransfer) domain-containing protein